ncbi:MAG: RNA polymerase sigma factor [Planctomycetota bacterium]
MNRFDTTCWFLVDDAANDVPGAREEFARNYAPAVRAYLCHRWRRSHCLQQIDDAIQELFLECFRQGGLLDKVDGQYPGGFRAFLYGVTRNVALRFETRHGRQRARTGAENVDPAELPADEATLSQVFDRSWLESILRQAAARQQARAKQQGADAERRVNLLELRFRDDLSFGEIAELWNVDIQWLYREAARARQEFKEALFEVVSFHNPRSPAEIERECAELLALLG